MRELRRLALRGEHVVQCRVDGIQRRPERQREFASAFGSRVARLQRQLGKETRAGFGERRGSLFDFERFASQRQIAAQTFGDVSLDERVELSGLPALPAFDATSSDARDERDSSAVMRSNKTHESSAVHQTDGLDGTAVKRIDLDDAVPVRSQLVVG